MNLPNTITLSRLFLTAGFIAFIASESTWGHLTALILFVVAAASDFLDGYLARKLNLVTPLGKLLDPLADKILVCSAFVLMSAKGICPVWITTLIIGREFLVTGLRQIAIEAGQVLAADNLGKWKTAFQLTYLIAGLIWLTLGTIEGLNPFLAFFQNLTRPRGDGAWLLPISLGLAVTLTVVSGWNYLWSSRYLLKG
ncbi:MAG: CDP-diacylglycerol--glycerol-3-phosphate 3-phosphatidyltransferase [Akkermansiaceae bacterium]|nr:CDP-diacylglycerol--glycerol-3-phosphate 3-phosphatidyltransferase [Akkermansiaceae bacterium]MDP4720106.1 CDP-diacylglycerol--glycerol-3-phosphate 3-phosphatidyltransferase [Akkermansiaceae bacterium]MDP4780935.1 CDP-diacylglycerol--glycerol-3-phosphate 3-phosphatidyltransferase [Akkermansiaceae bacterium]MDP4845758.1 CDP-diacylglycerol--glycerol-3-phosphate 3-phosphatidyltransferase [Akkermansiaceae bacterium]MDP4899128.1 CDP-diacylglycerol--glycerol-3-phosphate 3-phosphatidyltransferase [